jgi:TIR domain
MGTVGGHVFLSYGHGSAGPYVESVAKYLTLVGVPVWFDRKIIAGEPWDDVVLAKIDACVAVILVMTPQARASKVVSGEVTYAQDKGKPVIPLLLEGSPFSFLTLSKINFEDVTDGRMPSERLTARLRSLARSPRVVRQEVAGYLHAVSSMRGEAQRAALAMRLRECFGDDFIVERPSVTRIAFNFSRMKNGWCELRAVIDECPSELFRSDDNAVTVLMKQLDEQCSCPDSEGGSK